MKKALSSENRQFFHLLSEAATTNPFSDTYKKFQLRIADCEESVALEERLERIVARVAQKVRKLEEEDHADINYYRSEDRELLRRAFLFDAYHQFLRPG